MSELLDVSGGYRVAHGVSVMEVVARLREILTPIHAELEVSEVAHMAARMLDDADLAETVRPIAVVFDAIAEVARHQHQASHGGCMCAGLEASFVFVEDTYTRDVLMLVSAGKEEYVQALDECELVSYWPYWDAELGDRPRGIGQREWDHRGVVWARALNGSPVTSVEGRLMFTIGSNAPDVNLLIRAGDILEQMPQMEERVMNAVRGIALSQVDLPPMGEEPVHIQIVVDPSTQAKVTELLKPYTITDLTGEH